MCLNSSCCFETRCSKVIEQEKLIIQLRDEIKSLTKIKDCKSFKDILSSYQCYELSKRVHDLLYISDYPFMDDIPKEMTMFYTITFSPQRFYQHTDQQYIDYILYHVSQLYLDEIIWFAYGCFEHHKTGVIHAHVVVSSNQHDIVRKYLNNHFNHDARNRRCIDSTYIKSVDKVIQYLHKESKYFFKCGRTLNETSQIEAIKQKQLNKSLNL